LYHIALLGWYHIDQNLFNKPQRECVQGGITLYDCDAHTGGMVVLPGSHKDPAALMAACAAQKDDPRADFVLLLGHEILQRFQPTLVRAKAGDLLMWDSRVVHCNSPALRPALPCAPSHLQHCILYVCMTPASHVPESERVAFSKLRLEGYQTRRTMNHSPHEYNFQEELDPAHLPATRLPLDTLTAVQRDLICGTIPLNSVAQASVASAAE
jgi:hypothetical protein